MTSAGLGLDKLLEWVEKLFHWLIPFVVLAHFERGVVLTLGHYTRTLGPGFHFKAPLGIEEVLYDNVKPDGWANPHQSIMLKDGTTVTISYTVVWEITDIRQLLLEVEDKETVFNAITGYVQEFLHRYTAAELTTLRAWAAGRASRYGLREKLVKHVNSELGWTGANVLDVLIRDFAFTSLKDGVVRVLE